MWKNVLSNISELFMFDHKISLENGIDFILLEKKCDVDFYSPFLFSVFSDILSAFQTFHLKYF